MASEIVGNIISQARLISTHSWEYGTFAQALLEWHNPTYSVFSKEAFPMSKVPVLQVNATPSLSYAKTKIWTNGTILVDGDGAAGDPASLGVPAILIGQTNPDYLAAAERQMNHLLTAVPRWANGAISHREADAELWADFGYMVPPSLAYWAVQTSNATLLNIAIEQCLLYRDILAVPTTTHGNSDPFLAAGLWHHIKGLSDGNNDPGIWSTGNAWAAGGMSRVLATAKNGPLQADGGLLEQLEESIQSILDGVIALDNAEPAEPLLRNYLNNSTWFGELSGTTLLTATAYRVAQLNPQRFDQKYVAWADEKRQAISERIDSEGLLAPVVNPLNWGDETPTAASPEAQSFAILMFAAHRDFQA